MRRRFFVEQFKGNNATMMGEAAHHLGRVLRAQPGQLYELSDGEAAWLARIESVSRDRVEFALVEKLAATELALAVTLLLSIVKFEAFEWALEKATELGVAAVVPLGAARSDKALLAAAVKRSSRWEKILLESSQQSRRLRLPRLEDVAKPEQAFALYRGGRSIIFSERPGAPPIRKILGDAGLPCPVSNATAATAAVAIGPEGGWTDEELAAARSADFHEASLGRLVLRTETAVVSGLSILNYALSHE